MLSNNVLWYSLKSDEGNTLQPQTYMIHLKKWFPCKRNAQSYGIKLKKKQITK